MVQSNKQTVCFGFVRVTSPAGRQRPLALKQRVNERKYGKKVEVSGKTLLLSKVHTQEDQQHFITVTSFNPPKLKDMPVSPNYMTDLR